MRRSAALLAALLVAAPAVRAQQRRVDIQAYLFTVVLPESGQTIRASAVIAFEPRAGWDDSLRVDLIGMTIDSVIAMETRAKLRYSYNGRQLWFPAPSSPIMVIYHGEPRDGLILRPTARGRPSAFADNWPDRARYWLPVVDDPADKARVVWRVRAPRGWQVVTNGFCHGRLRGECVETAPLPTYTMVIGATRMTLSQHRPVRGDSADIPIEVWAYPEDSAYADSVPFRRATEIVETLQRLVGPFPYRSLAHVQSSTRYGGMENATAIFYAEQPYVERAMGEGVVRHETAHQWFGDAVTPAGWAHVWLSEGFASYFEAIVHEAMDGSGDGAIVGRAMREMRAGYLRSDAVDRPIVDTTVTDPNRMLNANSYQKGAWVLHMLRGLLGDSLFFAGVRDYYRTWRDSSVVTDQFRQVMERAGGRDLGWFFEQWTRRSGYPRLEYRWSADAAAGRVTLRIRQVQPAAWGGFRIERLPVRFTFAAGSAPQTRTVDLTGEALEQSFELELDRAPSAVELDPDGRHLLTATRRR